MVSSGCHPPDGAVHAGLIYHGSRRPLPYFRQQQWRPRLLGSCFRFKFRRSVCGGHVGRARVEVQCEQTE